MNQRPLVWLLGVMALLTNPLASAQLASAVEPGSSTRPRVIATTDGEVDDRSSMIRFLLYACDFDIAGNVQVNSKYQKHGHSDKKWIEAQLDAYEQVLPNLRKHNAGYPDAKTLRSVMRVGNETEADLWIAPPDMQTKDTAGAQLIIDTLLDDDPRPVHVLSWGGANTTASALWKLKTEYTKEKKLTTASRVSASIASGTRTAVVPGSKRTSPAPTFTKRMAGTMSGTTKATTMRGSKAG